jgi:hypothetical protein
VKNNEGKKIRILCRYLRKFLMATALILICFNAYAQETMQFDSEAKKLEFIRQMLKKEKYLRESEIDPPYGKQMMKDLLANKNFKAIEPDVRADSADDPRLAKWRRCEEGEGGPLTFVSLWYLGAPPYRYYRIELDGNKENGPEDMIYHNMPQGKGEPGRTGYTWVDLKNCDIKDGFDITGALEHWSDKPNAVYLNMLVYYKGRLWAMEFVDGQDFSLYHWLDHGRMETCLWALFKPEKNEKKKDSSMGKSLK